MPRVSGARAQARIAASTQTGAYIAELAWAPDGGSVAAAGDDGAVRLLHVDGGAARTIAEHDGGALTVAWSAGGVLASGGRDGSIALDGSAVAARRNGSDDRPARRAAGGPWVEQLRWRPDGMLLAAATGRHVQFWTPEGTCEDVSEPLPATVSCLDWHPRGVQCAAGSYGGVRLLRANGARVDQRLEWTGSVLALAFSPDGRRLAHGNQDSSVHFWDLAKGSELEMAGYETKVRQLAWSPGGRWLATGGGEDITLWDFHRRRGPAGSRPVQLEHADRLVDLAFASHGVLAGVDRGGAALLWRPGEDDLAIGGTALDEPGACLAWSPDGHRLAIGGAHGTILVVDIELDHAPPR